MRPELRPDTKKFLSKPAKMFIDGQWRESAGGERLDSVDPATGEKLTDFPAAGPQDVDEAVAAARRALPAWRKMKPQTRGRLLTEAALAVEKHEDELAELITLDNGKPLWEAKKEVATAVAHIEYFAGWATKLHGETIPMSRPGSFVNYTIREPLGVVVGITPPNYPLTMPIYKSAPALATGNTVIIKPSEDTSLVQIRLAEIFQEVDMPDGVFNVVTGLGDPVGTSFANHDDVNKIAFTGSTEVGRYLVRSAAGNLKKVSLELGGKSPNIVFDDADMEAALKGVYFGIFFCQGEICSAGSRLFVQRGIYDEFVGRLSEMARGVKMGHGLNEDTKMGPLVSQEQQKRVLDYIQVAKDERAKIAVGGGAPKDELSKGFFVEPTIFTGVDASMRIAREEVFGPVLCALPFDDIPDAVLQGNNSNYGLASGVWTTNIKTAHRVADELEAGTVWVNCYNAFDNASPWGGYKESGWGREKGKHALDLYTQTKSVVVNYA